MNMILVAIKRARRLNSCLNRWRTGILPAMVLVLMMALMPAANASGIKVFDYPVLLRQVQTLQQLITAQKLDEAKIQADRLLSAYPDSPEVIVLQAIVLAGKGNLDDSLVWLNKAAQAGFRDGRKILSIPFFRPLNGRPEFTAVLSQIQENANKPAPDNGKKPGILTRIKPEAHITESNTIWNQQLGLFVSTFTADKSSLDSVIAKKNKHQHAIRLRELFRQGLAAGNRGDIYDNRDDGHSRLKQSLFPQMAHTKYDADARAAGLGMGLNMAQLFNRPTIGNASLGVSGQFSMVRKAYENRRAVRMMQLQYVSNHLYVYPGVYDYAPRDKDRFTANTPFVVNSEGKSGTDRAFVTAAAMGMAAMQPAVKQTIIKRNMMAPVLQYLIRHGNSQVDGRASYLSAAAHPVVMDGNNVDLDKIVDLAQGLTLENLPLRPDMTLISEDGRKFVAGQQGANPGFTFPNAINRHLTQSAGRKSFTISAEATEKQLSGPSDAKPNYMWVLLEGDPATVRINPRGERNAILDVDMAWRAPGPALNGKKLTGSRTDIGLFVERNGVISAPSILSVWSVPE